MTTTCECGHERSIHTAIGCAICFNGPLPKHCLGFTAPAADSRDTESPQPLTAEEILSDEEIERRADSFNLDSDDWSSYVHHWKGYRDGLLASRDAIASLTARAVRAERRAADLVQDRSDVWRTLGIAQDADADAAIAAIIAQRAPRPATP